MWRIQGDDSRGRDPRRVFDQLDEYAEGILWMDEVDQSPTATPSRFVVEQTQPTLAQRGTCGPDVGHGVGNLLDPLARVFEELGHRRVSAQWRQELDARARLSHREHGFPDALLLVRLLRNHRDVEGPYVEVDGSVEIAHCEPDMVDALEHAAIVAEPEGPRFLPTAPAVLVAREAAVASRSSSSSVLVAGARTPMGKLLGALKDFSGADLGGFAIKAALDRSAVAPDQVDYVIMGQVLQAGTGQITARQAAVKAGLPMTVPALTINKVCLSGLDAIALADQLIRAGEFEIVVAGGMESMTNAPHLLPKSREGFRYGSVQILDAMAHDGLFCAFDTCAMGESTERYNAKLGITREEQDAFSARSHQLAAAAQKNGVFEEEIVPVEVPQRRGDPVIVASDEGVRADTTAELLSKLRPAFAADGTITAGSASQISDGAAAVVVMSRAKADELGIRWLAELGAHGVVAGPDASLQSQPANAIKAALAKERVGVDDLDLVEINEAFASVGIQSMRELGIDDSKVNVNGGAIALGHPIGMSGARLVLTLALELNRRGGGVGAAGLCGGGGQGDALVVRVPR